MPNSKNQKFTFGFLNTAQDPVDLATGEAQDMNSLDADELALGTLVSSNYLAAPLPIPDPFDAAVLGGRKFRLEATSMKLEFEEAENNLWKEVNQELFPPNGFAVALTVKDALTFNPTSASYTGAASPAVLTPISIDGETWDHGSGKFLRFKIVAADNFALSPPMQMRVEAVPPFAPAPDFGVYPGVVADTLVPLNPTNPQFKGVGFTIDEDDFSTIAGDDFLDFEILDKEISLPDGDFSYITVNVQNNSNVGEGTAIIPGQDIQGLASPPASISLKNTDDLGNIVSQDDIEVTLNPVLPNYTDEVWVYRKGFDDEDFIRIARFDGTNISLEDGGVTPGNVFVDTVLFSAIVNLQTLAVAKDESFITKDVAIANTTNRYQRLFEKDNRLWMVPESRPDLLIYSRQSDWWGWPRTNAFSFEGDIVDITFTRDPTTVGGEFTMIIFTTNGIFHITGNGTSEKPYVLFPAVRNITVAQHSVVDMNGIIMFATNSEDGLYDTGPYGQKIYEYNLQNVTEVSARVKTTDFITSTATIQFAVMIGSDKFLIKKTGVDKALLYHRDVQGWVELDQTSETSGDWLWKSKQLTPQILDRFKIAYGRKFKVDILGTIVFVFRVYGPAQSGFIDTTVTLNTTGGRQEFIRRLPALKGRKWELTISTTAGSTLYDFYFVI